MLPPFFYKAVSEDGLFRSYSEIIQRVGNSRLRIYLYHIPPVAQVSISAGLIERLLKAYPGIVSGIKDSSGDWNNTEMLLKNFQSESFDVFCGSEVFLLQNMRGGGAGSITATGNVNPAMINDLFLNWQQNDADEKQAEITEVTEPRHGGHRADEVLGSVTSVRNSVRSVKMNLFRIPGIKKSGNSNTGSVFILVARQKPIRIPK